mgnify:CR=1 FL=1
MGQRLQGQVAIITGASRGIGRAIAEAYAAEGASLCLIATHADRLAEVAASLRLGSDRLLTIGVDVRDRAASFQAVAQTEQHFAQIAELIGLWIDSQRTSREVKALAQRHLADLEEKRREIEQMMDGLSVLVKACHGNDQPHCAILEQLSRGSLTQHRPQHKPQLKKSRAQPDDSGTYASSHIDLMAWMRGVHSHQDPR